MRLDALDPRALRRHLSGPGVDLVLEPFVVRIGTPYARVAEGLRRFYGARSMAADGFADFHVRVEPTGLLRRLVRPQCRFTLDGETPFRPLPADQAFPLFEWGLNWAIANHAHDYVVIHAAVLARAGEAVVLPGPPGAGKTTLAAGLMVDGWRLLSDELTLVDLASGALHALARPLNLKNDSIERVRALGGDMRFGPVVSGTIKGAVCHISPDSASEAARLQPARLRWVVIPALSAGAAPTLTPLTRAEGLMVLLENSFNANVLGRRAFDRLAGLMDQAEVFDFEYHALDDAVGYLGRQLVAGRDATLMAHTA